MNQPSIAFLGKTGAGKTSLMNAIARQKLGAQAKRGQLTSQTTELAVYKDVKFLGTDKFVTLIDIPGLSDSEGRDQ